jgi:Zn-dependent M32 family carboxypeptidase
MQMLFPQHLGNITLEQFYRGINRVEPSFIRVEADEATYNMHIMLRFEIETGLLDGSLRARTCRKSGIPACRNTLASRRRTTPTASCRTSTGQVD